MNKIIVSIVFAIILVLGINIITDKIFYVKKPEKSAYKIVNVTDAASTTTSETSAQSEDIMMLFASTNIKEGEKIFKKCAACHSISEDGANKIGPALWGVLGRKAGSVSDYKYSKSMQAYGKTWSFDEMNGFLTKPKKWIKGTKMSFAGLKNAKDRAAVILYMNKNTNSPLAIQ